MVGHMDDQHTQQQLQQHRDFLHNTLEVDLTRAQTRHDAALQLVDELAALRNDLQTIQETTAGTHSLTSMVELGAGVLVQARVEDTRHVYVEAGLGFFVQCTLPEALGVVSLRQAAAKEALQAAADDLIKLRAHVAVARVGVQGLERAVLLG